ncbi:sugar ABC transporter substrate-binding protein [Rhodobacteraceae bacterium]|nr:sugar ABC transporter substrate-binding protein [Paracoccaceae bacterium]
MMGTVAGLALLSGLTSAQAEEITIATVNNGDMIIMQELSSIWEKETGNTINWVVLEENVLRQRVTTDIATGGGQYDVMTIGSYEAPIWGRQDWLSPLNDLPGFDYDDLIPTVAANLSAEDTLYAVPFYAESSFTLYRKDLFKQAGLTMPDQPTWDQIRDFAAKLTDKPNEVYGLCLRGKPGWGENLFVFGTMVNTFGGRWFDENWNTTIDTPEWKAALDYYLDVMTKYGPPGATSNGFNENQTLFQTGKCAMWIDATSAAGRVFDPAQSDVADKVAFTASPVAEVPKGNSAFWAWALAVPASSHKQDVAKEFISWATSADYVALVGKEKGWVAVPPGTRLSTYENPDYIAAAPFAATTLDAIESADPNDATAQPVPYSGIQYVSIPEFQGIGTTVGQNISAALSGSMSAEQALQSSQRSAEREIRRAGYGN